MCDMTHSYIIHIKCRAYRLDEQRTRIQLQHTATHCNTLQHNATHQAPSIQTWRATYARSPPPFPPPPFCVCMCECVCVCVYACWCKCAWEKKCGTRTHTHTNTHMSKYVHKCIFMHGFKFSDNNANALTCDDCVCYRVWRCFMRSVRDRV